MCSRLLLKSRESATVQIQEQKYRKMGGIFISQSDVTSTESFCFLVFDCFNSP